MYDHLLFMVQFRFDSALIIVFIIKVLSSKVFIYHHFFVFPFLLEGNSNL